MISTLWLKICRYRFFQFWFSFCSFLKWNSIENKFEFQNLCKYRVYNSIYVIAYFITSACIVVDFLVNHAFGGGANGKQDIFDVAFQSNDSDDKSLTNIVHTMYVAIEVLLIGCWIRFVQMRSEYVFTANIQIRSIVNLQGKVV